VKQMAILVDEKTKVLIQGITGNVGRGFAERMKAGGTKVVAGVTPGKGGQRLFDIPIFDSVEDALSATDANTSFLVVPAPFVRDAAIEALLAGVKKLIIYTEGVPVHDAIRMISYAKIRNATLVGPNSAGVVSPGKANVSDLSDRILSEGSVGIVSKSGTITYEVIDGLNELRLGQSTVVCLGGDPVLGTTYVDALKLFEADQQTRFVVLIGEIGGMAEVNAADCINKMRKPVIAYIAGQAAPPGKRIGHAGAIITRGKDTAGAKMEALKDAGAIVAQQLADIRDLARRTVESRSDGK